MGTAQRWLEVGAEGHRQSASEVHKGARQLGEETRPSSPEPLSESAHSNNLFVRTETQYVQYTTYL